MPMLASLAWEGAGLASLEWAPGGHISLASTRWGMLASLARAY